MTDEELAEKYVTENTGFNTKEPLGKIAVRTYLAGLKAGKDMAEADLATIAYMQGAEAKGKRITELENENEELKAQIEKMKCCNNCEFDNLEPPEVISNGVCEHCINHSKWKLEN